MRYTVYKNRVHKYAAVHKETCSYVKMHGGVSSTIPPTGEYSDGFKTVESARLDASNTGWKVKMCGHCAP